MVEMMKFEDIKSLDDSAIDAKIAGLREDVFRMKMEKATAGLEKPHRLKILKKNIAKLLTAKNAKK